MLLLNDPTRGVDPGTKHSLYEIFKRLARTEGVAIVLLSTELSELVTVCDRVLAFFRGRVVGEYKCPLSEDVLLAAMFGRTLRGSGGAHDSEVAVDPPGEEVLP